MSRLAAIEFWIPLVLLLATPSFGQMYEQAPIHYSQTTANDPVAQLQQRINDRSVTLQFDEDRGYLPSILQALQVPVSSQVLVFSKTSFQQKRISPRRPRAVYFSDDVYVGWVQNGDVVEISSVDPQQGAMFYSISQQADPQPRFMRHTHECLQCHASSLTDGNPGHIVRSVYPDATGFPILSAGSFRTDPKSPFRQRWGGWYVTGTHGRMRHMGNSIADKDRPDQLDVDAGANVTDLAPRLTTAAYMSPHSDIVALMVLEHQTFMHNQIAHTNYAARTTLHNAAIMNEMLGRPADYRSETTQRLLKTLAQRLLKDLLLSGEAPLSDAITGTSGFAEEFVQRGPRDPRGRSLRQLDLRRSLFTYPCSYLIYSQAFDALAPPVQKHVYRGLWDVLTGKDQSEQFAHLSAGDRRAIREILRETKTDLPTYWKS